MLENKIMERHQIEAFRELRLIERKILAGKDTKVIYKNIRTKLNEQNENSAAIKIVLECLECYMKDKGIEIPEYMNFQDSIEEEHKIIQKFIESRAQSHRMSISEYCMHYGLKYENLHI